ncbi:MAG: hypothetical protein HY721_31790 [Planctomycetes bacterium]|nr:hypothetical protein [Planctomycetota bacterium]
MVRPARLALLAFLALGCRSPQKPPPTPDHALPPLEQPGKDYRTPLAGEGFRTEVLGREVAVQPRDRSSVTAWDAGAAAVAPGVAEGEALPFASLYLWRRPDEDTLLRAVVVGVYNEVLFAKSAQPFRPLEGILTLNSFTVPAAQAEYVDGLRSDDEELYWGYVRPGFGVGYRQDLDEPGQNDNMLAFSVIAEPGFLYFDGAHEAARDFVEPSDTFEGRGRVQVRLDALERNLLELPHRGIATGSDVVYGYRSHWTDWGRGRRQAAVDEDDYASFTGYMLGAGPVPFAGSDIHRLVGSIHGGTGDSLDRFSGFRVGGGPTGEDYEAVARPVIPGAVIEELTTSHYAVAVGEYRWEPVFFTYVGLRASAAYVDRDRLRAGEVKRRDDILPSIGARLTTGFLFETRLQVDYSYSAGVIRRGEHGGHEVVVHLSGSF